MNHNVSGKGGKSYTTCLKAAYVAGEVGVNLHTHTPTSPLSRMGYRGKKLGKKAIKDLAEKMLEAAKKDPTLKQAALNAVACYYASLQ
jgi:hypothetical protein